MMLAKSLQSAAGNAAAEANYIESVFQTHLYTGNGSTQTITNGIDLAGEGGMVTIKSRSNADSMRWLDTNRGTLKYLESNNTNAEASAQTVTAYNSNGFSLGTSTGTNNSGWTYASWTFRKQPKFFDVVTYTGDGTANRNVAHALGAAPGFVIIKRTNNSSNWNAAARLNNGDASFMLLNRTVGQTSSSASWFNSTTFKVGSSDWPSSTGSPDFFGYDTNGTGDTYVAYLFAHNAGGFGLTGTDNVISCGSFTTDGSGNGSVTLGYEPQWFMYKRSSGTSDWQMFDNMRGLTVAGQNDAMLRANTSGAEVSVSAVYPTATGFGVTGEYVSSTWIYIAIRRGPMKVPESGTSVFAPVFASSSGTYTATAGFPVDLNFYGNKSNTDKWFWFDRLRGNPFLQPNATSAESASTGKFDSNTAFSLTATGNFSSFINYALRRAPSVFDVVCYTGNGAGAFDPVPYVNHNLGVPFELVIIKRRNSTSDWGVYCSLLTPTPSDQGLALNTTAAAGSILSPLQNYAPSAINFVPETPQNISGATYVAYLFASAPGVSKVFNYTGNGSSQTINCGFTGGARFVMIKRTDSTGDWYVWDTARGIVANSDPHLSLNTTAAEVTTDDSVDTASTGFIVNQLAATNINVSSATYIGLAIA